MKPSEEFVISHSTLDFCFIFSRKAYNGNPVFGREELLETNAVKSRRQVIEKFVACHSPAFGAFTNYVDKILPIIDHLPK